MAKKKVRKVAAKPKPIKQYEHSDKERANNPHIGLVNETTDTEYGQNKKTYQYDPHLDPQLQWAGKAEQNSTCTWHWSIHWKKGKNTWTTKVRIAGLQE